MRSGTINNKLNNEYINNLYNAVASLNSSEECKAFLEDICSMNEIISLSQRLEVAKLLKEGRTYLDIVALTGASTATISRVNRSINYGNGSLNKFFDDNNQES